MCEGPFGLIKYEGNGSFLFKKVPLKPKKRIVLIAGGTGVTPLYNIAANSIHAKEGLQFIFLYSNKTKDDILLEDELNELVRLDPNFKLYHTLTRHNEEKHGKWDGFTGRISLEMI